MKRFRVMAAALCAVVLLCGFSVPAYAYADGDEGADYGDPTMTEETPAPEPTIEPGEGFSEEGSLVTRDLLYDEHTNKQFITVQTSGGNTFYIVIDYDKPVDEEGEQYETYFSISSLTMTSPWTKRANSTKPTFSALWMRLICLLWRRPLAWNRRCAPALKNARRGPSIRIVPFVLSI